MTIRRPKKLKDIQKHKQEIKVESSLKELNRSNEALTLSASLEENKKRFELLFQKCSDFTLREFVVNQQVKAFAIYFGSLASMDQINRFILEPLMQPKGFEEKPFSHLDELFQRFLPIHEAKTSQSAKEVLLAVYSGDCVVFLDGIDEFLIINTREPKGRTVGEALVETASLGPHEGFAEDLEPNVALLRKRIKTAKFKMENLESGRIMKSTIVLSYIEGVVKGSLVEELKQRIDRIDTDGFIDTGHLRRYISDNKFSPFPQEIMTERPDRCINHLLEGRIVILLDGSPFALIYPALFIDILKTADEAYTNYYISLFIRFLRFVAFFISSFGSALYIALTVFHPGMIPTQLLITVASARAGVPFPAIVEAVMMEFLFELLREANIRIPKPIGPSISIVGGLVIGQSAVEAGIASQAMIIVVALTSITSFAVPGYTTNSTLRLIRFPFMIIASMLGMFGIISLLLITLIHIVSLRSVGIPYLAPFAPLNLTDIQNAVLHGPASSQTLRPLFLEPEDIVHTSKSTSPQFPHNNDGGAT